MDGVSRRGATDAGVSYLQFFSGRQGIRMNHDLTHTAFDIARKSARYAIGHTAAQVCAASAVYRVWYAN